MKTSKRIINALTAVILSLTFAMTAGAAQESAEIKSYTLSQEILLERISDTVLNGRITYTSFYNIGQVSREALQKAASASKQAGGKVLISFDTLSGDEVSARVTVNPHLVKSNEGDLCFIVDTSEKANTNVTSKFNRLFGKQVAVMRCEQVEDFGMTVVISGKLDLSKIDSSNLTAYSYNEKENAYSRIDNAKCVVDDKGFVHFQTQKAGYIIITSAE